MTSNCRCKEGSFQNRVALLYWWFFDSGEPTVVSAVTSASKARHSGYGRFAWDSEQTRSDCFATCFFVPWISQVGKKQCNYNWWIFNNCAILIIFPYTLTFIFISIYKKLTRAGWRLSKDCIHWAGYQYQLLLWQGNSQDCRGLKPSWVPWWVGERSGDLYRTPSAKY